MEFSWVPHPHKNQRCIHLSSWLPSPIPLYISLYPSLYPSGRLSVCLNVSISLLLFPSLCQCLSRCLSVSLPSSLFLYSCLCHLSLFLPVTVSRFVPVSLSLMLSVSLYLPLSLVNVYLPLSPYWLPAVHFVFTFSLALLTIKYSPPPSLNIHLSLTPVFYGLCCRHYSALTYISVHVCTHSFYSGILLSRIVGEICLHFSQRNGWSLVYCQSLFY